MEITFYIFYPPSAIINHHAFCPKKLTLYIGIPSLTVEIEKEYYTLLHVLNTNIKFKVQASTMPPRFPHGLKKNPIHMNFSEKTVFAMLGTSVAAGLFTLATSPLWSKESPGGGADDEAKDKNKNSSDDDDGGKPKPYIFQM